MADLRTALVARILKRLSAPQATLLRSLPLDGSAGEVHGARPKITAATLRQLSVGLDTTVALTEREHGAWTGDRKAPEKWRLTKLGRLVAACLPGEAPDA